MVLYYLIELTQCRNKFPEQLDDFGFGAFAFKLPPPDVLVHDKDEFFEGNLKVQYNCFYLSFTFL